MRYKLLRALFGLLVGAVVGAGFAFLAAYFWYFLAPNTGRAWSCAGLPPAATALVWVGLPFGLGGCASLIGVRD